MSTQEPSRWDALFADLGAQLVAQEQAVRDGEVAEVTRAEQAKVPLVDRLRARIGSRVALALLDGEQLDGVLRAVAASWLLIGTVADAALRGPGGPGGSGGPGGAGGAGVGRVVGPGAGPAGEHLVPVAAVAAVSGLGRQSARSASRLDGLGLGSVLREVQRDRARVVVRTRAGQFAGRLARVGVDHLDLEETDRVPMRTRTVPFWALTRVSRA